MNEEMINKEYIYTQDSYLFNINLINAPDVIKNVSNELIKNLNLVNEKEYILDRWRNCLTLILMNIYNCNQYKIL